MAFDILNDILGYGLAIAEACWLWFSAFCLLGLGYMLGGHRLTTPGHAFVNRANFYYMVAILVFCALEVAFTLYACTQDRSFGYPLIIFVSLMLVPIILSTTGVLLWRRSRFPLPRQA